MATSVAILALATSLSLKNQLCFVAGFPHPPQSAVRDGCLLGGGRYSGVAFGEPIVAKVGIDDMLFIDGMLNTVGMLCIDCVLLVNGLLFFMDKLFPALLWPAAMCCCPCKVSGCMVVVAMGVPCFWLAASCGCHSREWPPMMWPPSP